jgi:hypothetical protein
VGALQVIAASILTAKPRKKQSELGSLNRGDVEREKRRRI